MPRPKRARRAPAPAVAAVAAAAPEDKSSPAPDAGSDIYSHSDREHSVIRKEHEKEETTRVRRSTSLRQRQARSEASARDLATSMLDAGDDTTSKGQAKEERQKSDSSVEVGRKTRATPVQQRRDTTGLDLDDDMFEGLDTTLGDSDDDAAPPSAPRSDTSTFSVSHFRRRGRAPSISINRDDAPIRPSSRGVGTPGISSTFNIGVFKRRQREPSILGTAQKERAQRPIDLSSDSESGDDGDDFEPEAESTPLNRRRTQPAPAVEPSSEPEPEAEAEPVSDSQQILAPDSQPEKQAEPPTSSSSRKRKSMESHEEGDRPGKTSRTEPELLDDESDSELSDLPSPLLTPTRPSAIPRPVTPNQDDIMAPPESSGSEDDNETWPDIHTLAKHRRRRASLTTPTRDGNVSDVSSPPSLTHSPNFPATRNKSRAKKQRKSPKVTTADLTGLLPRRRHKKTRDPFSVEESEEEIDASGLAQGDDELSYVDARTRSRRPKTTPLNRSSANRPPSRGGRAAAKSKAASGGSRPSTRTYSRRLSDKENEVEGDVEDEVEAEGDGEAEAEEDSFAPLQDDTFDGQENSDPARSADELKKAARKFKEVDRWELEFEEVTESSSPNRDAR